MAWAVIHDTFEKSQKLPVVRHIFFGKTQEIARGNFRAHLKSDRFMRECTDKGNFEGRFKCTVKVRMQKVPG